METGYDVKEQQLWGEISQLMQRETQEEQEAAKEAAEVAMIRMLGVGVMCQTGDRRVRARSKSTARACVDSCV